MRIPAIITTHKELIMCNNNRDQAAALCKMYRERLQSVVVVNKASTLSPLAAEWILDHMDKDDKLKTTDNYLLEDFRLYYMVRRLSEFTYVRKSDDTTHKLTYPQRARLLCSMHKWRNWDVDLFELALKNFAEKLS
jgi:hypothetical protein